ncbi:MAG: hypothetical protein ABSE73_15905 [Planctomycetota bacterium]
MLDANADGLPVTLTDAPVYLIPEQPNEVLKVAAAWDRLALEYWLPAAPQKATIALRLKNPLERELPICPKAAAKPLFAWERQTRSLGAGKEENMDSEFTLKRGDESVPVRFECTVDGSCKLAQETLACVRAPLRLDLLPFKCEVPLKVENPAGEAFKGTVELVGMEGLEVREPQVRVELKDGEREKAVVFSASSAKLSGYSVGARLLDEQGGEVLSLPVTRFVLLSDFPEGDQPLAYQVVPDGDVKVASEQSLAAAAPPEPPPYPGLSVLKLSYRFDPGWKFVRLVPTKNELKTIEGQPKALTLWVYGDGSGLSLRMRFMDATGQCFQPQGPTADYKGWRPIVFSLDGRDAGHWGGANDEKVHYPIKLDTLFLLDNGGGHKVEGAVYLQAPTMSW